jgi:glycosyltransferase involved in cell wall biosynthesis
MSSLHKFTLAKVSRVIAVSEGVARGLREQHIFPDDKIRVIPNGISIAQLDDALKDFDRDAHRRTLAPDAPLLVGTVGELSSVKGQEEFVRAAALIIKRENFTHAQFLIIGEDRSQNAATRTLLQKLIIEHGLQEHMRLLGHASELTPLIASLDLYVSASRAEAFGLALLEALMCGVAAVATATDGARELIDDGVTGKLVPIGVVDSLAHTILHLLQNEDERALIGKRARAESRARFSLERMIVATEKVYCETLRQDIAERN